MSAQGEVGTRWTHVRAVLRLVCRSARPRICVDDEISILPAVVHTTIVVHRAPLATKDRCRDIYGHPLTI